MYISANMLFQSINDAEDPSKVLKETAGSVIRRLLRLNFAEWDFLALPEGEPPYNELEGIADIAPNKLINQRTERFIEYFKNKNFEPLKREMLFIQYLEGLPKEEAKLLITIKDKQLQKLYPNITRELVDQVFPDLLVIREGEA